jgi:hypothetical protein
MANPVAMQHSSNRINMKDPACGRIANSLVILTNNVSKPKKESMGNVM